MKMNIFAIAENIGGKNSKTILGFVLLMVLLPLRAQQFTTEANGLRHVVSATVGEHAAYYLSEMDGKVLAYSPEGDLLWKNKTNEKALLFEIVANDIDNDGYDELLAASGDGHIYCWSGTDGKLLWRFNPGHKTLFTEMAVLKSAKGVQIFAGGNDYTLYELNASGNLVSKTPISGTVRKIEVGNFLDKGKPSLFLMTITQDKWMWKFMGFLDPMTKKVLKSHVYKKQPKELWNRVMINDIAVADLDNDQKDDLLFFGTNFGVRFYGLNANFEQIADFRSKDGNQRYAHAIGTPLLPNKNEIAIQYGGILYVLDNTGKLKTKQGKSHKGIIFNDLALAPATNKLLAAGQIGGGNMLYTYDLAQPDWASTEHELSGRMAEVEKNMQKLYGQALKFQMPTYQKPASEPWVMITSKNTDKKVNALKGNELVIVPQVNLKESTDRSALVEIMGDIALKRDRRMKYDLTRDEIVKQVSELEAEGQPFAIWAGHGNDPFFLHIETMEAILEAAPTTCYGFIYAEMHNVKDPRVIHFIDEYVPRLAKACRKNGRAKLYFRYKNIFWGGTSHLEPWKTMFFSGDYADVLVPASEDTSSRTQEINLAGRVGMLTGGYIDDFAMRLVDDNPTSWRPYSPGGQRSVSPYLRQGALMAAYGSRYGIIFNNKYLENPGLNVLYALMKSGVLPVVDKTDIQSIGSWHLLQDVNEEFITSVDKHHQLVKASKKEVNSVMSVPQMHWAGASLPEFDFSRTVLGVPYRWTSYIPEMPYGMVPIAPIEGAKALKEKDIPYFVSDGRMGYDKEQAIEAQDFGKLMKQKAAQGAKQLPITVEGASWSAIRIDDTHTRVIVMDPGYLNPQKCKAVITLRGKSAVKAIDILTGKELKIDENKIKANVPAGSIRFIDISY